jgi:hypothetical protein
LAITLAGDEGDVEGITPVPYRADWVIPLQPEGTRHPVFVFPSSHSERTEMAIEARIAACVVGKQPFWGVGFHEDHLEILRHEGAAALGAVYAQRLQEIQPEGPFLFYGNCLGGYLAWETAHHLLAAGREIGGVLFYEVPLRSDFATVKPGPMPVHSDNLWRLSHYYAPPALPIHLTHLMTVGWHGAPWWAPWQELALGSYETVIIPGKTETAFEQREERIARHFREWIDASESRTVSG